MWGQVKSGGRDILILASRKKKEEIKVKTRRQKEMPTREGWWLETIINS